jgi:hypothetical protein
MIEYLNSLDTQLFLFLNGKHTAFFDPIMYWFKEAVNNLLKEIKTNRHHHEREMLLSASSFKGEIRDKLEKIVLPYLSETLALIHI